MNKPEGKKTTIRRYLVALLKSKETSVFEIKMRISLNMIILVHIASELEIGQ
jgi:hypothetical protein